MQSSKATRRELQSIIKKMTLSTIEKTVLPLFDMDWRKVLYTVVYTRQPINPDSVARVMCKMAGLTIPRAKLDEILGRLRFIVEANQRRTWHMVRLFRRTDAPTTEKPPLVTALNLPHRIANLMTYDTEVEALLINEILHWTVRMFHITRGYIVVHGCISPGEPIALFSSQSDEFSVLQSCVKALGYHRYENTNVYGEDIPTLLHNVSDDEPIDQLPHSDTDEKSVFIKPEPNGSHRDTHQTEEPASMCPRPHGGRYVEKRTVVGRVDKPLLLNTTVNLTIDSD